MGIENCLSESCSVNKMRQQCLKVSASAQPLLEMVAVLQKVVNTFQHA